MKSTRTGPKKWKCTDYNVIVEGKAGPGAAGPEDALDVAEAAAAGDPNLKKAQAENVRTTFTAQRNEPAAPAPTDPMAYEMEANAAMYADTTPAANTAALGPAGMAETFADPYDYRRKLLQARKHHQSPARKLLAMRTYGMDAKAKQKWIADNQGLVRRLAHDDMGYGTTMAPGSYGAPPANASMVAYPSMATTANPAMDAMYDAAVMATYGGAANPTTPAPGAYTTMPPVVYNPTYNFSENRFFFAKEVGPIVVVQLGLVVPLCLSIRFATRGGLPLSTWVGPPCEYTCRTAL